MRSVIREGPCHGERVQYVLYGVYGSAGSSEVR